MLIHFALTETGKAIRKTVRSGAVDLRQTTPHPCALQIRRRSDEGSNAQAARFYERLEALVEEFIDQSPQGDQQAEYMLTFALFPTTLIREA